MSKELDGIMAACEARMNMANRVLDEGMDCELNSTIWRDAHEQYKAAQKASRQQRSMHWTTSGDFSHLQSTPPVSF